MPDDVPTTPLTVVIVPEKPASSQLLGLVRRIAGPLLLVTSPEGLAELRTEELTQFFREAKALHADRRLILAAKDARARDLAARYGWETLQNLKQLRPLLKGQKNEAEIVRCFSPVTWREDIRNRLQAVGILSIPKVRIWLLLVFSIGVFLFAFLRLLPSAEIRIWPDQESGSFTTNVYLVASGATLPVPADRVRTLPLQLLTVRVDRTITYDQISKNFTGNNARMTVTVSNDSDEPYSLRKGTRLLNQAGMRFRLKEDLILPAHAKQDVSAEADPIDQYGEVLGARGNVPAGVKWDFPGLTEKERKLVYGRNAKPATGGVTSYVNKLTKEDIEGSANQPGARQRLEQELVTVAKQLIKEEIIERNNREGTQLVQLTVPLRPQDLINVKFLDFVMPDSFIGANVSSVPVQGSVSYTVILYDENELLKPLKQGVLDRVPPGKTVVESSLTKENMDLNVIAPWDDDFKWVKITADLTYTERYVINPITPSGAKFGKYIRDNVAGKTVSEAYRIIKNLPEVDSVEIRTWPPWAFTLPTIGTSIAIVEKEN